MHDTPQSGTTIADVAARAQVSIRTVSRVLNRSPLVNAETREKVEAVIAALQFRPSARARGLATGRSFLLGLVHNDRNALVLDPLQRGMVREASVRGYELVVHPVRADGGDPAEDVIEFVQRSRVDGVVVVPPVSGIAALPYRLAQVGVPAVALSSVRLEGYDAMLVADERGAAAAVAAHLLDLGHTRVALISGPADAHSALERRAGFVAALAQRGIALLTEAIGDYGFDSGVAGAQAVLRHDPRPTAIFAGNDVMAAAVLKVAAGHGLSVPGDLSVVGFDGSILAMMLTPALTTVRRPIADMAATITRRLIDRIEGRPADAEPGVTLDLDLHGSTAPPR
ncbi:MULTISPECIES: LacI family DNA-binding transcriptional regulator [unclassified Sphingomonas]|uniref:LacI family DNA-binding transcriptional regulator n=1 Tax=unclassified Sphingomonas TaxID=196159 RepID=UPI0007022ED6|nr:MULTISPECIES: LacI family DNA-binding transcriptional regulator [unclassified Sphingomonas]KQN07619.1 LacI family transcriptional regulator [Sphingomonas sp. Leaf25]